MTDRALDDFNVYADERRAQAYATLAFPGTYYLAYRDLPSIIARHAARGRALDVLNGQSRDEGRQGPATLLPPFKTSRPRARAGPANSVSGSSEEGCLDGLKPAALDLGCGAGRSTRFLRDLGFDAVGADISAEMIRAARALDPAGDYRLVGDGDYWALAGERFDLVLSAFTFDNVPTPAQKRRIMGSLRPLLSPGAPVVHIVSSPELYVHEWASFSTRDFPENRVAHDGDIVRTIILDTPDHRPVDDVLCGSACYREIFRDAGFSVDAVYRPLGQKDDPVDWVTETVIPPWTIYVLADAARRR